MSEDGADLGVGAEKAMKAVLGGPQPEDEDRMDPVQFEAYIMSATKEDANTYDGCARYAARLILEHFKANPANANIPTEHQFKRDENGRAIFEDGNLIPTGERNLTEVMFKNPDFKDLDLTGFMWGWAVNAARRCLELPSVPNPAIITIGGAS